MENVAVGIGASKKSPVLKFLVEVGVLDGSKGGKSVTFGMETLLFSFEFSFASLSKMSLFSFVFQTSTMLCVVFFSGFSVSWLSKGNEMNKIEISTICVKVIIVVFFALGFLKRIFRTSRCFWMGTELSQLFWSVHERKEMG